LLASQILVLEYREIEVTKHWHMEQIPAQISQHAGRREGEARGLDKVVNVTGGDFRRRTAGKMPQIVRPLPSLTCPHDRISSECSIRGDLHVVSAAGLPGVDSAHLPSAQNGVGQSVRLHGCGDRYVVLEVDHEVMRDIEIGRTAVAPLAEGPRLPDGVQ